MLARKLHTIEKHLLIILHSSSIYYHSTSFVFIHLIYTTAFENPRVDAFLGSGSASARRLRLPTGGPLAASGLGRSRREEDLLVQQHVL
jgi:hypothetical protein